MSTPYWPRPFPGSCRQDDGPARAGPADLLAVAVECAQAAPPPPITGVPAIAARGGTSLLVKTARRLLAL
ncbi:hypothetical protein ACFY3O_27865 [Streptomyces sp. NPDC001046]|uniref:hypothetical protein n=1 Tax=Streptomyces sp. NPDC001046 TaxID=3364543 RepID=UPI0036BC99E0